MVALTEESVRMTFLGKGLIQLSHQLSLERLKVASTTQMWTAGAVELPDLAEGARQRSIDFLVPNNKIGYWT